MNINHIVTLSTENIDAENYLPDASKIINGNPVQNVWDVFSSPDEKFQCGVWDAQAGRWKINYSEQEFCLILEGESVIHDNESGSRTISAGDQFIIPAGFSGEWEVPNYCKKVYVIYQA
ncbi:cupin domain-containing protein [Oceanicoccus sp. KOV_DT_Chl]|uniref:cupin domain-containing protein n=1 Tax=Oceanicoccus sp. KOV_DT_Chl TaxID=1904639 RepID=UPI000C7A3BC3|nr:cupin domain-containing protein [Oceanicoccus sp. KOV_DT_Chl]